MTDVPQNGYKTGPGNPPKEYQFKPGNPGGPGRPKTRPFRLAMERALESGRHSLDRVVDDMFTEAAKGNVAAMREIRETLDGKTPQPLVGDRDEPPIAIDLSGLSTDAIKQIIADTADTDKD